MNFNTIAPLFRRAWSSVFSIQKSLLTFSALTLCGLLCIFFGGIAAHRGAWMTQTLLFLPIFLSIGILIPLGILLIRIYHHEVKHKKVFFRSLFLTSWGKLLHASALSLPFVLIHLILSLLIGCFLLFQEIPLLGSFLSILLGFIPFLIYLATLVLLCAGLLLLFIGSSFLALREESEQSLALLALKRLRTDPWGNISLLILGLVPLGISLLFLLPSLHWASALTLEPATHLGSMLSAFFLMLPFSALLSPGVIFFFQFAAEAHAFFQRQKN